MREEIARVQHEIWSHWMGYLFGLCGILKDGTVVIPKEKVNQWAKQINVSYEDLTDSEKESDREQADKVINCLKELNAV